VKRCIPHHMSKWLLFAPGFHSVSELRGRSPSVSTKTLPDPWRRINCEAVERPTGAEPANTAPLSP
jgi:hypothetical protein